MRVSGRAWFLGAMALVLAGCASLGERNAFLQYGREARARRAIRLHGRTYTAQRLPRLDSKASLSDFLAYAALRNSGVEAAFYRWKAALERVPQVRSLPEPMFTYSYYIRQVETRVGPQRHGFLLSQTVPWIGKLNYKARVALQEARMMRQRYEAAKLSLFYRVKKAYYEYYFLGRSIAITSENLVLLSSMEKTARALYTVGKAGHADILKAQVELARLEDRLRTLKAMRGPLMSELNAALNRRPGRLLPWPKEIPSAEVDLSAGRLLKALERNNPKLRLLDYKIARQKAAVRSARQEYYPDLTFNVGVIETGSAAMPGTDDSGKDPVIASVGIRIPIWIGKYRAAEREAEAGYLAAVRERRQHLHDLRARLRLVLFRFKDAERKSGLYRSALLPKAEQAFSVALSSFATGKAGFLDLMDAQRTLLEFRLAMERALADRATWLARLEQLAGTSFDRKKATRSGKPASVGKNPEREQGG